MRDGAIDHGVVKAKRLADLSAADPGVRAEALRWLGGNGDSVDVAAVAPLVQDPGEFDDRDHDDPPESARTPVRLVALATLAELRPPGTFTETFDRALHDDDRRVRGLAAMNASATGMLARLAIEHDRGVQFRVALALLVSDIGREEALTVLERLRTGDDHAAVAAACLLNAVSGSSPANDSTG
ncbi:hypothetical protein AB0395_26605 [Streptosporangium sp. NPDC051023]|uniref:hypothetical protein n=1 Tax=Streptosporangium sp. NPDC051023 TaxID=3155410 RepID=UPI003450B660